MSIIISKMRSRNIRTLLAIIFTVGCLATHATPSGTVLYSQDFEGAHGWTLNVVTGTQGADPNFWVVSDNEGGVTPPGCGINVNGDKTLHVTSVFNPSGGAAYDAGGLCGFLFCPQSNSRAESPAFSTVGYSDIHFSFDYIAGGEGLDDNASVWINTGSGWTLLVASLKSPVCSSGAGQWTHYSATLPVSAENKSSVKIGFGWVNNDDGIGTNPSVAINNVKVETIGSNITPAFVGGTTTLSICQNAPATSFKSLMSVSDVDGGQTETWSLLAAPAHGTVVISSATASSGSTTITPGGTMTYQPATNYIGSDTFSVKVSDGSDTAYKWVYVSNPGPTPVAVTGLTTVCATAFIAHGINSGSGPAATYTWTSSNTSVGTINPSTGTMGGVLGSAPATTTVTATSSVVNGCSASVFIVNTVYPLTDPGTISGPNQLCAGGTISLSSNSTSISSPPYSHAWSSSVTTVATVNAATGVVSGVSAGTTRISYTATGCGTFRTFLTVNVLPAATITLSTNPTVSAGATSANLAYTGTAGSPDKYSITWGTAAQNAGFSNVSLATLPATPIVISIPPGAVAGSYTGTLSVTNSVSSCGSASVPMGVDITNTAPSFVVAGNSITVCQNAPATSFKSLMSVSDVDGGQTETWSLLAAPAHGTVVISSATASSGSTTITPGGTMTYQPATNYIGSDTFSVKVSDGSDTAYKWVYVSNPGPTPVAVTGLTTVCATAFIAHGINSGSGPAATYTWTSSNTSVGTINPSTGTMGGVLGSAPATTTVTATSSVVNGCSASVFVVNTVYPLSDPGVISGPNQLCAGGTISLSSSSTSLVSPPYGHTWSSSATAVATVSTATGQVFGVSGGTSRITYTASGCGTFRTFYTVNVTPAAAITISTAPIVPTGSASAALAYTGTAGSPDKYSITWGAPAITAGFTNVSLATLPASPITISVPVSALAGSYTGTLTAVNSTSGCSSTDAPLTVNLYVANTAPSFVSGASTSLTVCGTTSVNIASLLHVTDADTAQTLTWSVLNQPNQGGAVTITGATAGSGTDVTPGGTLTYQASTGYTSEFFKVQVSDGTASDTITVNVTVDRLAVSITSQTNVACNGGTTGAATVTATNGATPYTYSWSPAVGSSASISGRAAGAYTVTVTDDNSCQATAVATITQPNVLSASASQVAVSCNGGSNGSAIATVSGGTTPYNYSWSPAGGTSSTATGLTAGNYTVTVTDNNSCQVTASVTVTQPAALAATASVTATSCNGGSNGTAAVTVSGGTPGYTYSWSPGGGAAATATGLTAGTYTCTITDANFCTKTQTVTVTQPSVIASSISSQTNVACNGGSNGAATVTVSGGTPGYTYSWSPSGGTAVTAAGLTAGTYTCTITDANSCTKTQSVTVTQPTAISASISSQTNIACNGGSNGAATISASGGAPGYTYQWSPSGGTAATATGLTAGIYTCTVTDANSCTKTKTVTLTQPAALNASASQVAVSCNGGSNGRAIANVSGGTTPYTYSWSPAGGTSSTATGLTAGNYTVTVTDNNSCEATASVTVMQPAALTASATATDVSCNGGSNATATATAGGGVTPYTYSWSPAGGTSATATGLSARTYTVIVQDNNGCQSTATTSVGQPSAITATTSFTAVSCNGGNNGTASVSANGGTGTLGYSWAPSGGTANTATSLTAGTYTVTITDDNTCQATKTVTVTQPTAITGSTAKTDISCHGNNDGTATVTASGGTGTLTYSWAPAGGTSATATNLAGGIYTVTITDDNSCELTKAATIIDPAVLTADINTSANVSCNGGNNGTAAVTAAGGTAPYTYSWSPSGGTAAAANSLTAGTYTVTVTDAHSCTATASVSITEPTLVTASIAGTTTVCNNTGSEVFLSSEAGVSVAYKINGGSTQNATMDANGADTLATGNLTAPATYTLVSVTTGGCTYTASGSATVSVYPQATVNSITNQAVCNTANSNSVVFSGPVTGTTFTWTNNNTGIGLGVSGADSIGVFTGVNTGTAVQTATITVTPTANGCEGTSGTFTIKVNPTPVFTSRLTPSAICDGTTFSYVPTSATTGTSFAWSRAAVTGISNTANNGNNNPNETLNNTTADPIAVTYVYTLTANGCANTQDVTVTVNPTPVLSSTKTPATICDSTVFNYVPTSATAGTTFVWSRDADESFYNATATGSDNPAETLYLSGPVGQNAYYVYTLTANGCIDTEHLAVPVQPVPSLSTTLSAPAVCNNATFSYTANSATPATTFEWSRAEVTGINNVANSGTGNISETLNNTTTDPIEVTYIYTLSAGACSRTQPVRVTVNPTPVLTTTLTPAAICDNGTFNYVPASATTGTTYAWHRAAVTGISNVANSGNDDPNEALHNTTIDPIAVTYVYTLTANSCSNTQDVTVTVNPTPVLNSTLTATPQCNNTLFSYTPTSATTGTAFAWSRATVTGISNAANNGNDDPNETLVNTTADPVTVTYVYTLTANSCTNTQNVTVTVYPTPMLTSTLTPSAICNNTTFSYTPTSATAGTTFQWSRAAITGISNTANTGTDDPEETLHNTTADPIAVIYVYTLTANGCTNTQNVTVTVNPTPVLSSTLTAAPVCNNTLFSYTPTSATSGTAFAWSRATVTGISNAANTGNDDPAEILSNTTTDPIVVTYVYTLTANGCSNTQSVAVTVNPTPVLTTTLTAAPVCDSSLFSYDPASATVGTTYSWSRATVTGISNAAATGADNPGEYLVSTTPDPINVQYVYTLTANSCTNTQAVTVTVYPKPLLSTTLTPAAICDSTTFAYTPNSLTAGTQYVWSRDVVAGISNPVNADNTDPAEILDNTTVSPVAVTYVYTLTANGCHNTQNVTVTVNPTPVLTSTLTVTPICDSTLFSYVPTSATTGTTFIWSRDTMDNILNPSATGTDNPMEHLVNIAPFPVNVAYTYTLSANGCSHIQTVEMTVNPKPLLSSTMAPASICDSATFSYVPASLTSVTTYNWSRATVTGIANTAGTGTDDPLEVLYNTTADSIAVNYVYTLTAYGCNNTQNVQVYVKPTPKLSSTLSPVAICNSTVFSYTPTSATGGTAFAWTRAVAGGISNAAGTGTDNPMETLTNTTVNPVNVPYVFAMVAAGCTHSEVVTIRVNPTPKLSTSATAEVCSTAPFSYAPASATAGTSYAWTRAVAPGISNAAGSGSGTVNEVLYNTTNLAKTVTYRYTLTANSCSNVQNVIVTVDPTPVIPVIAIHPAATLCSKSQYLNFGASIPAADSTNYNWTALNAVVYSEGAGHTNAVVSFMNSGNASVILTAGVNGYTCYTRDTFEVAVSTSEAPNADIYYIHDHFFYTDNTVNTYQWGYDDATTLDSTMYSGQVDQNYYDPAPDFAGKHYWVITTKDGCLSKSYYNAPTGVMNVNSTVAVNITVAPNPANNLVSVTVEGVSGGNDKVELTDLTGKTVITEAAANNKALLNVSNLASGVYIVTYYHNGVKAGTTKLVKE